MFFTVILSQIVIPSRGVQFGSRGFRSTRKKPLVCLCACSTAFRKEMLIFSGRCQGSYFLEAGKVAVL